MAHEGQQISNPRTGQRMTFLELREELLRIDSVNPNNGAEREPGRAAAAQPTLPLLKALATVLGPLARARGYRGRIAVDPTSGG